jgi:hypothetical protein
MSTMTSGQRVWRTFAVVAVLTATLSGCGHLGRMMSAGDPPAESEFGYGPRRSSGGLYDVAIEPAEPLRVGRMQRVTLIVRAAGQPVDGATISVDGGMPQHGHGLPTAPRVTRGIGGGAYLVEGVKFNMGGWWELRFRIASPAGSDSVTFNLHL